MEPNEIRLIALVNALADVSYPIPDDPEPVGPWGPWIRDALKEGPHPEPWSERMATRPTEGRGRASYRAALLAELAGLAGQVDDHDNPFGGRRPRPNWDVGLLLRDPASLNPQPLPPLDPGIHFARALANVAFRRAQEAGEEKGGSLLRRFSEDWCGTFRIPVPPKPGDPDDPRPPRPEESLVLGAALVRMANSGAADTLKRTAGEAGYRIFKHGLSGLP